MIQVNALRSLAPDSGGDSVAIIEIHKRTLVLHVEALVCSSFSVVCTSATSDCLWSSLEPSKNSSFFFSPEEEEKNEKRTFCLKSAELDHVLDSTV